MSSVTTAAASGSAPPVIPTAVEMISVPQAAASCSSPPSAALAALLGPRHEPPFNEVIVTGLHRRSGDKFFLKSDVTCMVRGPRNIFVAEEASVVVESLRAFLEELSEERLLSIDRAWMLMGPDGWQAQQRADMFMRLMTSLWIVHNCPPDVFWPTLHQTTTNSSATRSPPAGTATAGTPAASVAEAEVAVAT